MSEIKVDTLTGKTTATTVTGPDLFKTDELQGKTTANDITVTVGATATQSLGQGLAKAWCSINMDSASIRDSFSTSSIVDNQVGGFSINFTNAMTNSNFAALNGQQAVSGSDNWPSWNATVGGQSPTTTRHYLGGWDYSGNYSDVQYSYIGILGDLA